MKGKAVISQILKSAEPLSEHEEKPFRVCPENQNLIQVFNPDRKDWQTLAIIADEEHGPDGVDALNAVFSLMLS